MDSKDGCKSAWGSAVDMINHVKNPLHLKNSMLKIDPGNTVVAGLTKNQVLIEAAKFEKECADYMSIQVPILPKFIINFFYNFFLIYGQCLLFLLSIHKQCILSHALLCFPKNLIPWWDSNPGLLVPEADAMSTAPRKFTKVTFIGFHMFVFTNQS
jgi:hypothetical protein